MRFAWASVFVVLCASSGAADQGMLAAVNPERAANGRSALVYDTRLEAAARAHGLDMAQAGFFDHTGSDGSDIGDRLGRVGYPFCFGAENIAAGQRSLKAVMQAWMGSRGHRGNILHRKAEAVGVARVQGNRSVMVLAAGC
ncbi:MAG: CAP domain-containing protein [Pseudomonadota bacterium]